MSSNLYILRNYAQKVPSSLPSSILFSSSSQSLTIYDAFPKSIFHFLILPRVPQPGSSIGVDDLDSLKSLLAHDKATAREILNALNEDAIKAKKEIETEMQKRYGFKCHLHLHVLSSDLCSPKLKHKKHYNSFNPKLGFFLHIDEVLSWFDSDPSYYDQMAKLDEKAYEKLLKEDLVCWKCESPMKNIPTLKEHLQEEWDKESKREKARAERKRKLEEKEKTKLSDGGENAEAQVEHIEKKAKTSD
ncbi:hypothetical protein BT96DRAFT_954836 [Gymnopus androsaceus JB14]|uniref:Aprataxin C2HE/C2H2/C2HC zinc finger domain-containing protein n=1 Tax=Gymnopus androsaceus JB14 TaxID=1447944 RepID=A0A6A4I6L1_9AGAR|nr:hypothetical protein BT96DRAFT_954836 [Gymnopus androsaceus JB14]